MKKVLSLVLILTLVLGSFTFAFANTDTSKYDALVESGLFGQGGLRLDESFTRAQFALVALRAAGYTDEEAKAAGVAADFADVPESHFYYNYIGLAQELGLVQGDGTNFNPSAVPTYRQVVAVLLRILGYEEEVTAGYATNAHMDFARTVGFNITSTVAATAQVKRAVIADLLVDFLEIEEPTVVQELVVKSVSVLNPKQIQVVFGAPVDTDTVVDANGDIVGTAVKIDNATAGFTGKFNTEKTVLTLTKNSGNWNKDQVYVVAIEGVKNAAAEIVPPYAIALKMVDTTAPSIVSAKALTNQLATRSVTLTFTEPVQFTSVKVNGKFVSATTADAGFGAVWTLTTNEDLDAGSIYTVEVNNLKDLFNNLASPIVTTSVTVVRDNVKPLVASVTPVNETRLTVKFDKEMATTVNVDSIVVTKTVNNVEIVVPQSQLATRSAVNKDTFTVYLAVAPFESVTELSRDIKVTVKGFQDTVGNVMDATSRTVTITRDTVKPSIVSVTQKPGTQNTLIVTFSENVVKANGSAVDETVFYLRNNDGTALNPAVTIDSVSGINPTTNTVELTLSGALAATGTYRLVLVQNSIKDLASIANFNTAQVVTFNFNKSAAAINQLVATIDEEEAGGITVDSNSNKKVEIVFSEAVVNGVDPATGAYKDGAADNPANYTVDGVALPVGTTVTLLGNTVTLNFGAVQSANMPNAFKNGGTLAVGVSNVKSVAGSTVQYTTAAVTVADATRPTVTAAYLTGNSVNGYQLTVVFSEAMGVVAQADFLISDASETATLGAPTMSALNTTARFNVTLGDLDVTEDLVLVIAGAPITTADEATNTISANAGINIIKYIN